MNRLQFYCILLMVMNTMDLFCTYEQSLILKRKIFFSILKLSNGNGNIQKISTKDYWNLEYPLVNPLGLHSAGGQASCTQCSPGFACTDPRPTHTRRAAAASTGLWGYGCCGIVSLCFLLNMCCVLLLENVKLHDVAFKPCINKILHHII